MKHFYNTNHESGKTLVESELHNKKQEEWILTIFQKEPNKYFSREDIEKISGLKEGSVSRTLANLTNDLKIQKTHNFRISSYGKKVHTWKLYDGSTESDSEFENVYSSAQSNLSKPKKINLKIKNGAKPTQQLFKWMEELK